MKVFMAGASSRGLEKSQALHPASSNTQLKLVVPQEDAGQQMLFIAALAKQLCSKPRSSRK
jgi:hypothetical protein